MKMETPSREKNERIAKITQKLSSIQGKDTVVSKSSKIEQEELKIKMLEDHCQLLSIVE